MPCISWHAFLLSFFLCNFPCELDYRPSIYSILQSFVGCVAFSIRNHLQQQNKATNPNFFAPTIHVSHDMVVVVVVVVVLVVVVVGVVGVLPSGFLGHTKDRVPGGKSVQR
jgi:hypothetical protein